jgi:hypothetical protein
MSDTDRPSEVLREFRVEHPDVIDAGGQRLAQGIERALEMVPADGEWAIVQRHPVVIVRSAATLFQIRVDPREHSVTLASRPLSGERLAVELDWDGQGGAGEGVRHMRWSFRYEGVVGEEEWQRITGTVICSAQGETPDRRERFARNLARQAGWLPPRTPA